MRLFYLEVAMRFPRGLTKDVSVLDVSPSLAEDWFGLSSGNRSNRNSRIKQYANDMRCGKWHVGNDAILFDKHGRLRNGHHRLLAIMLSGVTVKLLVRCNVDESEIPAVDGGLLRNDPDSLNPPGSEGGKFIGITKRDTTTTKAFLFRGYATQGMLSRDMLGEAILKLRPALDFVYKDCFQNRVVKGVTSAAVQAVFARAYYNPEYREQLKFAGRYLVDGPECEYVKEQKMQGAANLWHLYSYYLRTVKGHGSGAIREIYRTTQRMIYAFLHKEELKRISNTDEELFPIPKLFDGFKTPLNEIDVRLMIPLRKVAMSCGEGEILSPCEVARRLMGVGMKSSAHNPEKAISAQFSKSVGRQNGKLIIEDIGRFVAHTISDDPKRIRHYMFTKD